MSKIKDIFNSFKKGIDKKNYPSVDLYSTGKTVTKGLAIMLAGSMMVGCQTTGNNYENSAMNLQALETTSSFSEMQDSDIVHIANGGSGVFIDDGRVIVISNINDNGIMSPAEQDQLDMLVSSQVQDRMDNSSAYLRASEDSSAVGYIHVVKGDLLQEMEKLEGFDAPILMEKLDKYTTLHELAHFYTVEKVEKLGNLGETTISETAGDVGGSLMLLKVDDLDKDTFIQYIAELIDFRIRAAHETGMSSHHTAFGMQSLKIMISDNPEMLDNFKNATTAQLMNASIEIAHSFQIDGERDHEREQAHFEKITSEVKYYVENGSFPANSTVEEMTQGFKITNDFAKKRLDGITEQTADKTTDDVIMDIFQATRGLNSMDKFALEMSSEQVKSVTERVSKILNEDGGIHEYSLGKAYLEAQEALSYSDSEMVYSDVPMYADELTENNQIEKYSIDNSIIQMAVAQGFENQDHHVIDTISKTIANDYDAAVNLQKYSMESSIVPADIHEIESISKTIADDYDRSQANEESSPGDKYSEGSEIQQVKVVKEPVKEPVKDNSPKLEKKGYSEYTM